MKSSRRTLTTAAIGMPPQADLRADRIVRPPGPRVTVRYSAALAEESDRPFAEAGAGAQRPVARDVRSAAFPLRQCPSQLCQFWSDCRPFNVSVPNLDVE